MAHDAPPSFLVLVRLQVTGEGSQEGLNEGLIPLSDPIAPVPLTLGSPWEPEADRGGVLWVVVWPLVGQQAEAGRRVSGVPRAPPPGQVVPKLWGPH